MKVRDLAWRVVFVATPQDDGDRTDYVPNLYRILEAIRADDDRRVRRELEALFDDPDAYLSVGVISDLAGYFGRPWSPTGPSRELPEVRVAALPPMDNPNTGRYEEMHR